MPVRLDCPTKKTFRQFKSAISAIYLKMLKHFLGLLKKKLFTTNAQNICDLIGREEYKIVTLRQKDNSSRFLRRWKNRNLSNENRLIVSNN